MMILLDLSSVRRLLCSWLAVGEFGWTVMLSTAISSNVLHSVHKNLLSYALLEFDLLVDWLKEEIQFMVVNSPLTV